MKHYTNSNYALNKYSEGIVYRFADSIVEVTLADYLAENPDKTECDFQALKELSDEIYRQQDRAENAQTKKNDSLEGLDETQNGQEPSPEELLTAKIEAKEEYKQHQKYLALASHALDKLTEVQKRRYLLHRIEGITTREIASIDGCSHQSVVESLAGADKKIKKFLAKL